MKKQLYYTWAEGDEKGKAEAISLATEDYEKNSDYMNRGKALQTYRNIVDPNTSIRDSFSRDDYNLFRPGEANPKEDKNAIAKCIDAYNRFPIVRNVIDLMSDFSVKGIDVVHPNVSVQKFGIEWFKKVNGRNVSERIANILLKAGNVVIRKSTARLPSKTVTVLRNKRKANGSDFKLKENNLKDDEIPISYTTLNPCTIEVIGGELAPFLGKDAYRFAVELPARFTQSGTLSKKEYENIINSLPAEIRDSIKNHKKIVLEKDKTIALYYKKDDWEVWAKPIIYPLLDDLSMYDKLRMADRAALDGAISHVRLWRLGDIKERIFPTAEVMQKLSTVLNNNVGGGCIDLVWGPELDFKETTTDIYKFLGMEKYVPHLEAIYQGLGVPPSMTGSSGASGGFTNNVVSLNTLIERLEYIRSIIIEFWTNEFSILQQIFGFRNPFTLVFDSPNFTDQSAVNKLLIDLVDRNIVSDEFVLDKFGAIPEIERIRVNREQKEREKGKRQPKAGQFHDDSRQKQMNERSFVNQGELTPSQVGLELKPKKEGEVPPNEKTLTTDTQTNLEEKKKKKIKKSDNGRPVGTNDTLKRKQRVVNPRTSANLQKFSEINMWAIDALAKITNITQSVYLKAKNKANLRQLTASEVDNYEKFKFCLLCSLETMSEVNEDVIKEKMKESIGLPQFADQLYKTTVAQYVEQHGEKPSIDKLRNIQAGIVALYKIQKEVVENG